ncbi:TraM recognition domain-containing protein [Xenorhabdus nematophila]|uniref:TraM recognition domain-containing protein n=1 Tax=Xenorhabdus nematophila TaxID=628 RepID=UPI0032B72080
MGREDDFLHLNLLSGDKDPYQDMVNEQNAIDLARSRGESEYFKPKSNKPRSNSLNPFFGGTADFQLQLLVSLLPKASGDGAQWQEKARNLADAIIRCLRYKHIRKEIVSGIEAFRHYMGLEELVKLYQESVANNFPEAATLPIYSYLKTGLSFDFNKIDSPSEWTDEVRTQHGYLTSQFSRTLAMMMDSYGAIYKVKYPEIDMTDVLLNNRILLISIPSMEKSPQEAESLGKLAISSIRLMMAESLGSNYEGDKEEILNARPTASPFPYPIITDELAYYYAQGLAVMYAQARSLGFMMVVAVQDIQGLQRGSAGEETASLLANTKFKCCLALEDTKDTYEMIKAAAGEGYFSTLSGYDYHNDILDGWGSSNKSQLQQRSRLEINDVKELDAGQGFLIFKDSLVEFSAFYIPDDAKHTTKLKPRINQFIQIEPPENKAILEQISIPIFRSKGFTAKVNNGILFHPEKLDQFSRIELIDPIRDSIRNASIDIWEQFEQDDSEEEFQIKIRNLTWEAALNGLKKANLQFEHNELYSSYLVAPLEESLQDVF